MKTSHRAIKKALKSTSLKPWQRIAIARGERRIIKRAESRRKLLVSALSAMSGVYQIAMVQSQIDISKQEKALRITQICIDTAMVIGSQ